MQDQAAGGGDAHVLSGYEELLRRPDFILEPSCWGTIVEYIKAGGKPEQLVESLSDSYVGKRTKAQMHDSCSMRHQHRHADYW